MVDGEFETAQDRVQEVLAQEPGSSEALSLQQEIQRYAETDTLLEEARAAQDAERYTEALQLVRTILELTPDLTAARLLEQQIESVTQADKAIVEVEVLAKSQQFKAARARLMELARQGVEPEKLRETQQLVEDLEREQWNRVVRPIEDLYRDGDYAEALNRCQQALRRTAAPELVQELENKRGLIINRWVETQTLQLRSQLQRGPDEETLREIEAQLQQLLSLEPPPDNRGLRQLEDLLKDTRTRRLQARLAQARERYTEWVDDELRGSPQAALDLVRGVQEEAANLGTQVEFDITLDAAALETEIQETLRHRDEELRRTRRAELLEQARGLRKQLEAGDLIDERHPGRPDLERVSQWTQEVLRIEDYARDGEALELETWAQEALAAFDRTREALDEAQRHLRARRFRDADYALRGIGIVSPLLKEAYEAQRTLVSTLRQAEDDQDKGAWDLALEGYRQALELDADLQPLLEKDLERCYQRLLERVREEVTEALSQVPPHIDAARRHLARAQDSAWEAPFLSREYARLRAWLTSQAEVARAAELLQGEGDPLEAQAALQEARRHLPRSQSDLPIRQWEPLAEALVAWQQGQLSAARQALGEVQAPIADLERVRGLRSALERAVADADLITNAAQQIQAALTVRPARYAEAVQLLRQELEHLKGDPRVQRLQQEVYQPLRAELESQRQAGHYAEAISKGELLLRLAPHDAEVRQLVELLPQERQEQLDKLVSKIEAALAKYEVAGSENALQRAQIVAAPEGDSRLVRLKQDLDDLRTRLEKVRAGTREVSTLADQRQWAKAVEHLLELRQKAPGYEPVRKTIEDTQRRLLSQAEMRRQAEEFTQGVELCDLNLQLEPLDEAQLLRERIRQEQQIALQSIKDQVQDALENWRLEPVAGLLERWQEIDSEESGLQRVQERYQGKKDLAAQLRKAMHQGWEALQKGDYPAAIKAFNPELERAQQPAEVQIWHDYTRTLSEAIQMVEDADAFEQSAGAFREAIDLVRLDDGALLPDIFEGEEYLKERRRHALYNAYRLRQTARKMALWYKRSDEYYLQGGTEGLARSVALVDRVEEERQVFKRLSAHPSAPPDRFPLTGLEDEPLPADDFKSASTTGVQSQPSSYSEKPEPPADELLGNAPTEVVSEEPRDEEGGFLGRLLSPFGRRREPPTGDGGTQEPDVTSDKPEAEEEVGMSGPTPVAVKPSSRPTASVAPVASSTTPPVSEEMVEVEPEAEETDAERATEDAMAPQKPSSRPPMHGSEVSRTSAVDSTAAPDSDELAPVEETGDEVPAEEPLADIDGGSSWGSGYWAASDSYTFADEE
jgi:hypothetical protein